ncbi:MAG TPA: hypothetical protein VGV92_07280 [Gammaproteobacteria bacterium]|nr:hypothetical protein [Gammaproteobacteria bacterium]
MNEPTDLPKTQIPQPKAFFDDKYRVAREEAEKQKSCADLGPVKGQPLTNEPGNPRRDFELEF